MQTTTLSPRILQRPPTSHLHYHSLFLLQSLLISKLSVSLLVAKSHCSQFFNTADKALACHQIHLLNHTPFCLLYIDVVNFLKNLKRPELSLSSGFLHMLFPQFRMYFPPSHFMRVTPRPLYPFCLSYRSWLGHSLAG